MIEKGGRFGEAVEVVLGAGVHVYAIAIVGLGVETLAFAHNFVFLDPGPPHPRFEAIPVLPFLPAIPWLAYLVGAVLAACGLGLPFKRTVRISSAVLGSLLFLCTLILEAPRSVSIPADMGLRTLVFEPLAIACLALLLPGPGRIPRWLDRASRSLLALSLFVFGVDHFLALAPIGSLIPGWIPWHVFWIGFFGAGFIAAGLSIGLNVLLRWGATCLGLMFAIWVFTLHLPMVLGWYVIPGRTNVASMWSSLLIAVALWGGAWAVARTGVARAES